MARNPFDSGKASVFMWMDDTSKNRYLDSSPSLDNRKDQELLRQSINYTNHTGTHWLKKWVVDYTDLLVSLHPVIAVTLIQVQMLTKIYLSSSQIPVRDLAHNESQSYRLMIAIHFNVKMHQIISDIFLAILDTTIGEMPSTLLIKVMPLDPNGWSE